jgi:choline dehydrogenase-like flavoprotein
MGTCSMGISRSMSVVKPTGESWDVKGLYVADTSVFPTASGVKYYIINIL